MSPEEGARRRASSGDWEGLCLYAEAGAISVLCLVLARNHHAGHFVCPARFAVAIRMLRQYSSDMNRLEFVTILVRSWSLSWVWLPLPWPLPDFADPVPGAKQTSMKAPVQPQVFFSSSFSCKRLLDFPRDGYRAVVHRYTPITFEEVKGYSLPEFFFNKHPSAQIMAAPIALPTSQWFRKGHGGCKSGCHGGQKMSGCGTDADQRDFQGKFDAEDRVVVAAGDKVGQGFAPVVLNDIIDQQVFYLFFGAPDDHLGKGLWSHAKFPAQNCGAGEGLFRIAERDAAEDMQGVCGGETALGDLLLSGHFFKVPGEADSARPVSLRICSGVA